MAKEDKNTINLKTEVDAFGFLYTCGTFENNALLILSLYNKPSFLEYSAKH